MCHSNNYSNLTGGKRADGIDSIDGINSIDDSIDSMDSINGIDSIDSTLSPRRRPESLPLPWRRPARHARPPLPPDRTKDPLMALRLPRCGRASRRGTSPSASPVASGRAPSWPRAIVGWLAVPARNTFPFSGTSSLADHAGRAGTTAVPVPGGLPTGSASRAPPRSRRPVARPCPPCRPVP